LRRFIVQEQIGSTAGSIYRTLAEKGEVTTTALKKELELDDTTLLPLGIGWLAREGKVQVRTKGKTMYVSLTPNA
jgi:hypothetical protein